MTERHFNLVLGTPERIAIVRSLPGLGDLLCAVPAFRALRAAFPAATLTLIGLPVAEEFAQRFRSYLDEWREFPGYPGIPEAPIAPFSMPNPVEPFDLVLQLHGNGSVMNGFARSLGATVMAGFCLVDQCPDTDRFLPYPEAESEVWRLLRLLEFLGIPLQGDRLEFPIQAAEWQEWQPIAQAHQLVNADYVCLHPGASTPDRRWSPSQFAIVGDRLAAAGLRVVLTGTAAEAKITQAVADAMQSPAIDLAGQTNLGVLAALLQTARLLVCNDTGVSHLAAALQIPSVVIFSNSEVHRWRPLDRQRHRIVQTGTQNSKLKTQNASTDAVLAEAFDLLSREIAYAS